MSPRRAPGIRVERATPLAQGLLLVVTSEPGEGSGERPSLSARRRGKPVALQTTWLDAPLEPTEPGRCLYLAAAALPPEMSAHELTGLRYGNAGVQPAADLLCPPLELAGTLGEQDADAASELAALLAATPDVHGRPLDKALAAELAVLRDALRQPYPTPPFAPGPFNVRLERVAALDDRAVLLTGWVHASDPHAVELTAISPEGSGYRISGDSLAFHPRPAFSKSLGDDGRVSTLGFGAVLELEHASRHPHGWILECRSNVEGPIEHRAPMPVRAEYSEALSAVADFAVHPEIDADAYDAVVVPALTRLRARGPAGEIAWTLELGELPIAPYTSVVVAVSRVARIEHQLAQFARDLEFGGVELLFVVVDDDPDAELSATLEELYLLYGAPFRALALSRPRSRSRMLNLGVTLAGGDELVLISGDLLPDSPGWVGELRAVLDSSAEIMAVGPKLLDEDDSIAHAGAEFERGHGASRWRQSVPLAGFARSIPEAQTPQRVQLLSSACMMTRAETFASIGGFPELYLDDVDECGDLCLALASVGGESWYAPGAELYLLDSRDATDGTTQDGGRFNEWLLERRWGRHLAAAAAGSSARFVAYEDAATVGTPQ